MAEIGAGQFQGPADFDAGRNVMSESQTVHAYLTREIEKLIRLGPIHSITWVSRSDPGRWMQVSVHDGSEHYLAVMCVLPPNIPVSVVNRALGKPGRTQHQANRGTCLIYYLAQSEDSAALLASAESAADRCAAIAKVLWNASTVDQFELLGSRGPKLPLFPAGGPKAIANAESGRRTVEAPAEGAVSLPDPRSPGTR
jgi:hypothetical protein